MDEFPGLFLDGFNDLRVAVPGGNHCNSGGKIKKAIAIYVPNFYATAMIHNKGVTAGVGRGDDSMIPSNIVVGFGAG
jgi:hypothetical protein